MKKAVILGNTVLNYSWFVLTYRQGLKLNGIKPINVDYKSHKLGEIKERVSYIKPDFIFTHLSFHSHINPVDKVLNLFKDIKNKMDVKIIHTCNDARFRDRYQGDLRGCFDAAFVGTYPMVENCKKSFKIPVFYSPYSSLTYDESYEDFKKKNFNPEFSFNNPVFTGSPNAHRKGWKDNRADFIERLQKIMDIRIFKTQSREDLRSRTPELSISAKCILGLCVGYEIDGYMDVRPFQYLGTGAFMIMRKYKDMDKYIPDDLYIPFHSYDDAMIVKNLWNEWKNKNTDDIRKKAFEHIQANHSCRVRIKEVIDKLNQI